MPRYAHTRTGRVVAPGSLALSDLAGAVAYAVHQRAAESRNVARHKVIELAADVANLLPRKGHGVDYRTFYGACGFDAEDVTLAEERSPIE